MPKPILACYHDSPYRSIKHTTYFPVYERLFERYRGKPITFVEVGILDGGSLFMWRDFFGPEARIIGLELNPGAEQWRDHGFEIFIGSQSDPAFWKKFYAEVGEIDILMDDGGHTFEQQIITYDSSIDHIRDGGMLVIEDAHTSYMSEFGGPSRRSLISFAKNVADGINYRFSAFADTRKSEPAVFSVEFFESIVAFHVDRTACAVRSEPTNNGKGEAVAADYRYSGSSGLTAATKAYQSLGAFRQNPAVQFLKRFVKAAMGFATNWPKNVALGKYFRY